MSPYASEPPRIPESSGEASPSTTQEIVYGYTSDISSAHLYVSIQVKTYEGTPPKQFTQVSGSLPSQPHAVDHAYSSSVPGSHAFTPI